MNLRFRGCGLLCRIAAVLVLGSLIAVSAFAVNPIPQVVGPPIPQAVVPGSGPFTLTVYGANFVSGAVVNWNRQPRSTKFISARKLQAKILASDVAQATAGYITVTNPPPGGGVSSSSYATVEVHTPTKTINPGQPEIYFTGYVGSYEVVADFTGDGRLDLATGLDLLYFSRNNGDGTFQPGQAVGGYYAFDGAIAFGDFTGDGKLDLVYAWTRDNSNFYLNVLLGKGNGKFSSGTRFRSVSGLVVSLVAGDFNCDGKLDLVTAEEYGPATGGVFLGNGDGTFREGATYKRLGGALATADLNGDGKLDLILNAGGFVFVRMGNGNSTFKKQRRVATIQIGGGLAVDDFNGDGIVDLAFADDINAKIGVLIGNGNGTFKKPVFYPVGLTMHEDFDFAAGDFNSDGKTDFIATQANHPQNFAVLLGNGDGTFQKRQIMELPAAGEQGMVVADFNADGLLDFDLETPGGGVAIFLQQ